MELLRKNKSIYFLNYKIILNKFFNISNFMIINFRYFYINIFYKIYFKSKLIYTTSIIPNQIGFPYNYFPFNMKYESKSPWISKLK